MNSFWAAAAAAAACATAIVVRVRVRVRVQSQGVRIQSQGAKACGSKTRGTESNPNVAVAAQLTVATVSTVATVASLYLQMKGDIWQAQVHRAVLCRVLLGRALPRSPGLPPSFFFHSILPFFYQVRFRRTSCQILSLCLIVD